MGDILVVKLGEKRFTWGGNALGAADETRCAYIAALKAADNPTSPRCSSSSDLEFPATTSCAYDPIKPEPIPRSVFWRLT